MKWIKASERQPEDWSKVLVREIGQPRSFSPKYKLSHRGDLLILDAIGHPIKDVPLKFVEWLDESDDWIEDMYLSVYKMHPYKEKGNADSYSKFNEGWSDACSVFESELEKHFEKSNK